MIYEEPVYRPLGDSYVTVEFGDEATITVNLRVVALRLALNESPIAGVRDYVNTTRSLGIIYNPFEISYNDLVKELKKLMPTVGNVQKIPSRLFRIPVYYNDPWSLECAQAHGVGNNLEYVAEINNLSPEEFIQKHTSTTYWVASLGFIPGAYNAYPMNPEIVFSAPKYKIPRTWTPERTVAFAGASVGPYPIAGPGGYQALGRTPVNLYELEQKNHIFRENDSPILARVGDRQIFFPITEQEYHETRQLVEEHRYTYDVTYEEFDIENYLASVHS